MFLVPGSASDGVFVARAFAEVIGQRPTRVVTDPSGDAERIADRLLEAARDAPPAAAIGVSVGAHAIAWWAARSGCTVPCVLAMPAWTGDPGPVAAATEVAAQHLAQHGVHAELTRLEQRFPGDWVVAELVRTWSAYHPDALITSLCGTARSRAPGAADLRAIRAATTLVALADDPLHPAEVAGLWADLIPTADLVTVQRDEPAHDVGIFGRRVASAPARPGSAQLRQPRRWPPAPPAAG